jgi:hypothetical protein
VPQADGTLVVLPVGADDALMPSLLTLSDVMSTGHHAALSADVGPRQDRGRRRRRSRGLVRRDRRAGFDRLAGKGISYGAARSEAANTHGLDVHVVGAGNSAGQAAMFFSNHARSVTILYRGESLEKSMSRYLFDQLAARSNIRAICRTEVPTVTSRSRRSTSATAQPPR